KDTVRWSIVDEVEYRRIESEIPIRACVAIRKAVKEFGADTTRLLHHVYATGPMLEAKPGQRLVLRQKAPDGFGTRKTPKARPSAKEEKRRKSRVLAVREEVRRRLAGEVVC